MTKKANFYAIHGAFYYLLCSVLVILMVSGCTRDVYDPNGGGEDKPNSFDFSTTSTIQLNVKLMFLKVIKCFSMSILKIRLLQMKVDRQFCVLI